MNTYGSSTRRIWSGECYDAWGAPPVLNPPADFTMPSATYDLMYRVAALNTLTINNNSTVIIHNMGLFCNFADGLVFKEFSQKIFCVIKASIFSLPALPITGTGYVSTATADSPVLTGVASAFLTDIPLNDTYLYTTAGYVAKTRLTTSNTTVELHSTYPIPFAHPGVPWYKLIPMTATTVSRTFEVGKTFNTMVPVEMFINPSTLLTSPANVGVLVIETALYVKQDVVFLTKSIDTTYKNDVVKMNVGLDVECTRI